MQHQLVLDVEWIPGLGARFKTGVDGISVFLVILTTFLMPLTLLGTGKAIDKHVREFIVAPETKGNGSTWDLDLSTDAAQTHLYTADGENNQVWMLLRESGQILGSFGRNGRSAGQFHWVHNMAVDSMGNIYTTEVDTGKRAQKFVLKTR